MAPALRSPTTNIRVTKVALPAIFFGVTAIIPISSREFRSPGSICSDLCEDALMKTAPKARMAPRKNRSVPCAASGYDGQIAYELDEFRKDYGNPAGRLFTFELTYNGTTYVYANVA